jgi:tetratricopeptide (TPR) repeat protein
MFASHPPSQERVDKNKHTADELGRGGDVGQERYVARIKPLTDAKPAYDKFDEAQAAARNKDLAKAKSLTTEAARMLPKEGRFQEFLGEIALAEKQPKDAITHYQKAIELNPTYYGSYLGGGVAQAQAGDKAKAEEWLKQSAQLLPTAPAAYYLGNIARDRGDTASAMQYYKAAASSNSKSGQAAAAELVRLDLPQNPGNYVATAAQVDSQGRLMVVVENRAPVALTDLQVTPVLVDANGQIVKQGSPVKLSGTLKAGERSAADAGIGVVSQQQLASIRFRVDGARIAQ